MATQWIEGSLEHTPLYGRRECVYAEARIKCRLVSSPSDRVLANDTRNRGRYLYQLVILAIDPPASTVIRRREFYLRESMRMVCTRCVGNNYSVSWEGRRQETYTFRIDSADPGYGDAREFCDKIDCMLASTKAQVSPDSITLGDIKKMQTDRRVVPRMLDGSTMTTQHLEFFKAVVCADVNATLDFIHSAKVEVNCRDQFGRTALHRAAARGDPQMVVLLLDEGANIDACENDGWTALHMAARYNCTSNIRELLHRGADVNATDYHGRTALFLSTANGDLASVEVLLEHNAIVNLITQFGSRATEEAADREYTDILKILQEKAADQPLVSQAPNTDPLMERALDVLSRQTQMLYASVPRLRDIGPMCVRFFTRQVQRDINRSASLFVWVVVWIALLCMLPQSVVDMVKIFIPTRALAIWESLGR